MLALMVVACGSDDGPAVASSPPAPTAPVPAPAPPAARGALLASAPVAALDAAALDQQLQAAGIAVLAGPSRCGAEIVSIRYQSIGPHGEPAELTGAALIPVGVGCAGPFQLASYSRGTDLMKARTLADAADSEAVLVAAMLTGRGIAVVASDYLGYAGSTWPRHPYLHADSEASAAIDALRAMRTLAASRAIALDPRVHAIGYSQGGHASLATQARLEQLPGEFTVAGGAHLSGPHDLVLSLKKAVDALPLGDLGSTYYVPFAVTGLQSVYGNLYPEPGAFFRAPYAARIESLFPGTVSVGDLLQQGLLPLLLSDLITDAFVAAVRDPASPLSVALAANASYRFTPRSPVLLCGGSKDPVVDFDNSRAAAAALTAAAGAAVTVIDVEQVAAYEPFLESGPLPSAIRTEYHSRIVPPLCLLAAREGLPGLAGQ
jgi:pimeloyl-ACP methyl ester carboxylesterase